MSSKRTEVESDGVSRRNWLKLVGSTGIAAGAAGCSESDPGTEPRTSDGTPSGTSDSSPTEEPKGDPVDPTFSSRIRGGVLPNELQWNQYNIGTHAWVSNKFIFDRLAMRTRTGDFAPSLASNYEVTESAMKLDIHPDATWHDGKDVTAEDVALKFEIELATGGSAADFFTDVQATGDKSLELSMDSARNKDLVKTVNLDTRINTPPGKFEEFAEGFADASTDEEKKSVQQEMSNMKMSDPVGNGPFKVVEATPQRLKLEKHGEYHFADRVGVPKLECFAANNENPWPKMRNDEVDGVTGAASVEIEKQFPDNIRRDRFASAPGKGLLLNHDTFDDYRIRQAICWMHDLDRTRSSFNHPETLEKPPKPMGHSYPTWVSEDVHNSLNEYNATVDTEKATSLLKDVGYTKEDGKWYKSNGDRWEIALLSRGDPGVFTPFKNQLDEFGVKVEIDTKTSSKWAENFFAGNFDVFYSWWGLTLGPDHPWFQMQWEFDPNLDQYVEPQGKSVESLEVPMPVGDPNGSVEEINALEEFNQLGKAQTKEEFTEHLDVLTWAWNQSTPVPQLWTSSHNHWADTKDWNWPSSKEMVRGPEFPFHTGWRTGDLTPKYKDA